MRQWVYVLAFVANSNFRERLSLIRLYINMNQFKSVLLRFLKGAAGGAVASMVIVTIKQPTVWTEFLPLLTSLGIAGTYGALTGLLLALQKWASWTDAPTE